MAQDDKMEKVVVEYTKALNLDEDDISDIKAAAKPHDPAELQGIKRVVIPEDVRQQMIDAGIDLDKLIGQLMHGGKLS